jgi:hypothetical protein
MAEHWISAETALALVKDRIAICTRAHFGLVKAKARLLVSSAGQKEHASVPDWFWWAKGNEALDQNWHTGDFETSIRAKYRVTAFGVTFALSGILDMLPAEKRAELKRSLTVAGNAAWITAREALRHTIETWKLSEPKAQALLIESGRLGQVQSRALLAQLSVGDDRAKGWAWEEHEWDVADFFWQSVDDMRLHQDFDWSLGRYRGLVQTDGDIRHIELSGLYFLRASLPEPGNKQAAIAPAPTGAGGRPPASFSEEMISAIWALIYQGDFKPRSQAEIERKMLDWSAEREFSLSESSARSKAKLVWVHIKEEVKNSRA